MNDAKSYGAGSVKAGLLFALGLLVASSIVAGAVPESLDRKNPPIEEAYEKFRNPPADARPFVRWWWSNNQVEEREILRQLDVLKAAGIGGVEINGKNLGVIWYGSRPLALGDALRKGENQLAIRYTTTLWNAMGKKDLQPSGLIGPVIIR